MTFFCARRARGPTADDGPTDLGLDGRELALDTGALAEHLEQRVAHPAWGEATHMFFHRLPPL